MSRKVFGKQASFLTAIAVLIVLNTFAAEEPEVKALLSDSLLVYNKLEQIKTKKKEAVGELNERLSTLRLKIKLLKEPVFDEEKIWHYKDNIAFSEDQISVNKAGIEFSKITDPNERTKLAQQYDDQRKRILAEELLAAKPFNKRIDALAKETEGKQKIFEEVTKEYFRWPKKDYPAIVRTEIKAKFHAGSVTYEWWDAEHKHQAFCYAQIKLTDPRPPQDNAEMLNDKFCIVRLWSQSIEVWVGCFSVQFNMRDPQWWGEEKMRRYIRDFVDLEGLARIDPDSGKEPADELVRGSLACSKRYRKIVNEKRDAVKPLTNKRVKVKQFKARLKKPPADSEQIRKDQDMIDHWGKECQSYRTRLEIGTLEDSDERTVLLETLHADQDKLKAEKRSIEKPYNDQMEVLTRGLKAKNPLLNNAMKIYFRTELDDYEDLGEMITRATFSKAKITCSWEDRKGDTVCSAIFFLRNHPPVPDDAEMLDNQYYVDSGGDKSDFIWLWIGNFHVYFDIKKEDWLQTERVDQIVKKFIDLSGLEKISMF